jgi:uncharacterized protein involved in exopolysaccharide biosynthesis
VTTENRDKEEIDLLGLVNSIWRKRRTIYVYLSVFFILGVIVALTSPTSYRSYATLMPEYNSESGGGASDLLQKYGGLIGIGGGATYSGSSNAIRVDLYPRIVYSMPFQMSLLEQKLYFSEYDTTASIFEYYSKLNVPNQFIKTFKKYTIGLPGLIFSSKKDSEVSSPRNEEELIKLTKVEADIIELLRNNVTASLDEKTGIITVTANMPEATASAKVAQFAINELTDYLVDYRVEKVKRDLEFVEQQLNDAKSRFEEAQDELAVHEDSNQGIKSAKAKIEGQRLSQRASLAFNVYQSLAQQFEDAKLRVQEETPVFKVLQPVQIPVERDKPKRKIIVILFMALGFAVGIVQIIYKVYLKEIFLQNFNSANT